MSMTVSEYARKELDLAGYSGSNDMRLQACIEQLIDVFEQQRHHAHAYHRIVNIFSKLAQFQPISPLMGTDDEWIPFDKNTLQNIRYHHVYKNIITGKAYDTHVYVFRDDQGHCSTDGLPYEVIFPYTPRIEYIKVTPKTTLQPPNPEDLCD